MYLSKPNGSLFDTSLKYVAVFYYGDLHATFYLYSTMQLYTRTLISWFKIQRL